MPEISRVLLFALCLFSLRSEAQTPPGIPKPPGEIQLVVPIDWSRLKTSTHRSPQEILMGKILLNANKYALGNWWTKHGFDGIPPDQYLPFGGINEHNIRPIAAEAEALAVSLRSGLYNAALLDTPANLAEEKTIQLIRSLTHAHRSNTPNGWGHAWQSPLWATYTAFAAWMMWDKLDDSTRTDVLEIIRSECNWTISNKGKAQIKTYRDRKDHIISPGDTGAEENAWDSEILGVACAMMPDHPTRKLWMNQLIKLTLNAVARPSDLNCKERSAGKPVKDWLVGSNINEDGTVVNHHIIHPDYMADLFEFNAAKFFYFANLPIPKALTYNMNIVFNALANLNFRPGNSILDKKVLPPGGTIFRKNSGDIYYPVGTDWGKWRRMNFVMVDCMAAILSTQKKVEKKAKTWELLQGQVALDMQSRFKDGHTYLDKSEDSYPSREEWIADKAANCYLIEKLKERQKPVFTNAAIFSSK
jgi:hypothetical protein